jgi:NitT/TauT family transport system substrate-binding protein
MRRPSERRPVALIAALAVLMLGALASGTAGIAVGARSGHPIRLTVGYQPYYTEAWSALVMRKKQLWKRYLPAGSQVTFQSALQGSLIVGRMLAGKQDIGYMGDMPAIVGASERSVRDLRIVATLGLSRGDQCAVFLVRPAAPVFASQRQAVRWMDGKTVATPHGSCADRIAQVAFRRLGVSPGAYVNEPIDEIASSFRRGRIDAAIVWEPMASRLVNRHLARRVGSGALVGAGDAGLVLMSRRLLARQPDVAEAWLKAELDAQRYLADPAHADELVRIALGETKGFDRQELWDALYRTWPAADGGSADGVRMRLPFAITATVRRHIAEATAFLYRIKAIASATLPAGAVAGALTEKALRDSGEGGAGVIRALPRPGPR